MRAIRGAILAVVCLAAAGPLAEPHHVRFELADGVQISGSLMSWDDNGFDGSFGPRFWEELQPRDAWRLYLSVMDQNDANQWVNLGRVLLLAPQGESWARRAFQRALDLDAAVEGAIDAARLTAAEAQRLREQLRQTAEAQRLATSSPESGAWPPDHWPRLDPAEQQTALLTLKAEAREILQRAGRQCEPIETSHLLLYSDAAPIEAARWSMRLEAVYARMAAILGLDADDNVFWGKAVILMFESQDVFRLVEAESFGQLVSRKVLSICHPVGPKVFIVARQGAGADELAAALVCNMVHGFLHRHGTPHRPPAWANEGIAEAVATEITGSGSVAGLRNLGLRFIRSGGDVAGILDLTYDEGWPGPANAGPAVGALLVELMINQRPDAFAAWIDAVKNGKDWQQALAEDFGVPRDQLLDTFVRYYRVND